MDTPNSHWDPLGDAPSPRRRDGALHDDAVSVRQIVAYNLARARKERGMTQDELGETLHQLTGKTWSATTVSAAESGWDSRVHKRRVRHFDVNEVAAFALALRVPLTWFFLPPSETPGGQPVPSQVPWITVTTTGETESPRPALTSSFLHWLALSDRDAEDPDDLMWRRLKREGLIRPDPETGDGTFLVQILDRLDQLQRQVKDLKAEQR